VHCSASPAWQRRQGGRRLRPRIATLPAPMHITHIDCIPATIKRAQKRAEHRQSPFPFQFGQRCAQQAGCGAQPYFGGVAMLWEALRVARCAQLVLQATHARLAPQHAHGAHLGTFALAGTWAPLPWRANQGKGAQVRPM
jgi:hypothetical protein